MAVIDVNHVASARALRSQRSGGWYAHSQEPRTDCNVWLSQARRLDKLERRDVIAAVCRQ